MGRPPKPDHLKRTDRIVAQVTPEQKTKFDAHMKAHDLEGSSFIRNLVFPAIDRANRKATKEGKE